ncbi:hypothetical protein AGMMS50267_14350 [Spirochaetia bacterium]|nr:hypothetical protein AGMMS50267_14350 [Spirochaetia bacterium]
MLKKLMVLCAFLATLTFIGCGRTTAGEDPEICDYPDCTCDPCTGADCTCGESTTSGTSPADKGVTVAEATGTGTLVSVGKTTIAGATTYYIDYAHGNDSWDGTDPLKPWKTFRNINKTTAKTFKPGDHILLEARSTWNGTSVTTSNYKSLLGGSNAGMMVPKGNGEAGKPIVIDLYQVDGDFTWDAASYPANTKLNVYYSANQRPVINGNGTPSINSAEPYNPSGVIHLVNQSYWEIRNLEITNTFDNPTTKPNHWYDMEVRKGLAGIMITRNDPQYMMEGNVVKNCYVHDVQSEHTNNGGTPNWTSNYFGGTHNRSKGVGGIFAGYKDVTIEGNIVKKVGLEGIRNNGDGDNRTTITGVKIIGNYVELTAGDGIVISGNSDSLVEGNVIKDSCAAPNLGGANYAACWCYRSNTTTFQYNEAYGTLYGNLDGEAWDIDNQSDKVVYQYNYSHQNAGGAVLFMGDQTNGIFRYNISANDGGGSRYMATIANGAGAAPVDPNADPYKNWTRGQSLIHYCVDTTPSAVARVPLVHNNTFYIGDGLSPAVYGRTSSGSGSRQDNYVRFYNNILLKVGALATVDGTTYPVSLSNVHNPPSYTNGQMQNETNGFKNNLLWGYDTNADTDDTVNRFVNSGTSISAMITNGKIKSFNPKLKIQETGGVDELRAQRDTPLPDAAYTDPAALAAFTGKTKLRARASLFAPVAGSPVINAGMAIPGTTDTTIDNAWNDGGVTKDFFDQNINAATPPIGAAAAPYTP